MINYTIKVKDATDDFIGEFTNFRNLKFSKKLNNYGVCQFDVPIDDVNAMNLIDLRKYTIWVYRKEDNNAEVLEWSGEQALTKGNLTKDNDDWVTLYSFDWFEQLAARYTAAIKTITNTDAGQIAWTLINDTQSEINGNFGITQGSIEATQNRDREYYNQNVAEAIVNLANVINGFDFEITNDRVFNVYAFKSTDKSTDVHFEYEFNITDVEITQDYSKITNRAIVLGQAYAETELQRVERNDALLQATNLLRENVITEMDVTELQSMQDKGDAVLRKYKLPLLSISMNLTSEAASIDDFALGDLIGIKIIKGCYNINSKFRVYGYDLEFNENGSERLSLILGDFNNG